MCDLRNICMGLQSSKERKSEQKVVMETNIEER